MDTPVTALGERILPGDPGAFPHVSAARTASAAYTVQAEAELEFHEVAAALLRRRYLIAACILLGVLGGLLVGAVTRKTYSATATVEYAQPNNHALGLDDPTYNSNDLSNLELLNTELKTQLTEITDDATTLAVIRNLHLDTQRPFAIPADVGSESPLSHERGLPLDEAPYQRERVIKLFQQHLNVEVVKGTRLLNVTYTDSDPVRAAAIANAVVSASADETSGRHSASTLQVTSWLSEQLAALKQRVEESQRLAETYASANSRDLAGMTAAGISAQPGNRAGVASISESVPVSRLLALNSELTSAQVARIAKEAIYRAAQSGEPDAVLSIGSSSLVSGQGADSTLAPANGGLALLQHLRAQQVEVDVEAAKAAAKYGAKNQVMVEYNHQRAAIHDQIDTELQHIRDRTKSDLDLAVDAEKGLRTKVNAQQGEVSEWTTKADHLLLLQGEAASSRALYQDLFAKLQESQFAAGIRASRVTLLDAARVPSIPAGPKKRADLGLGALVGLVLGFLAAFLVELLDDSLHSERQVIKAFGVPVLGSIPHFPRDAKGTRPFVVAEPRSVVAEAYRSFRTATFTGPARGTCKILLVTSALSGEGKGTTCLNAAASLAVQGHRVLLLNADMRRSQAREPFGVTGDSLSACLKGEVSVEEAVQPCGEVENLFLLPAGPAPENPSELLSSKKFVSVLGELRSSFDYVLMDSPPALLFTDARILAAYADAYVMVVKASRTQQGDLRKSMDNLYGSNAAFLGLVFNGVRMKSPRYAKLGYAA